MSPQHASLISHHRSGHMLQLLLPRTYGDYEFKWQKLYGPVYRLRGCFGVGFLPAEFVLYLIFNSKNA
jgi:hypothetical protein